MRSCVAPTRGTGHRAGSGRLGARQGVRMRFTVFLDRRGRGLAVGQASAFIECTVAYFRVEVAPVDVECSDARVSGPGF